MIVNFHPEVRPYLVDIASVQQHPQNPNNGDVEAITESILSNGFYSVCIAQKSTGRLLAGNHRYAALLALGAEQIPVAFIDVSDERSIRILVGDNRTAELAVRNGQELEELLRVLEVSEEGLSGTGYDDESLAELKRLNDIQEHAGFGDGDKGNDREEATLSNRVLVVGFLNDDTVEYFDSGDVAETISRMRDLGYHAVQEA